MAQMSFVCLYLNYLDSFACLSDAARGKLVTAMLTYASTGVVPSITGPARYLWPSLQSQIDRDLAKYHQRCEANRIKGAKGGKAPRKATASQSLAQEAKEKEKEKEKDNEKEKDKENEKEKEMENGYPVVPTEHSPLPFFPPDVHQVRSFCREQGLNLDAQRFVDYYTSNGWRVGSNPMQDWKAAARNWARKEDFYGKNQLERTDPIYGTVL